jgi:hypothetical protein
MAISWDLTGHFFNEDFQIDTTVSGAVKKAIKVGASKAERSYGMAGYDPELAFSLLYKQSSFTTLPVEGDNITVASVVYTVKSVEKDSRNITVKYGMVAENG